MSYTQIKEFRTLKDVNGYLFEIEDSETIKFKDLKINEQFFDQYCATIFYVILSVSPAKNKMVYSKQTSEDDLQKSLNKLMPEKPFKSLLDDDEFNKLIDDVEVLK